ncbi:MAG TPA: S9 family peptidase [Terriglobales bacterium]|jgi:dipeptidyl aminopeptidase/acylaminoacyl peptidase|nr:S9 family peptidase [Terriglobales bacterium]
MRRLLLAILLLAISSSAETKLPLTSQQAIAIRRLSDLRWSPDASQLAFTVTEPPKGTTRITHIWVYSAATKTSRQLTYSAKSESHARWSPDAKTLAFLSDRDEYQQIFLLSMQGGEARRVTTGKRAIQDFAWSPDGKSIAFLAPEAPSDEEDKKEKNKDDAKRVDLDDKNTWLWIADAITGTARLVTSKPYQLSDLQWTNAGDRLIVVATDHPESDQETNRIFAVNATDGKMQQIAAPRGPFGDVKLSPDGKQLSYIGCRTDGPSPHDLFVQPVDGSAPAKNLTGQSIDRPIENYAWLPDGWIMALASEGFRHRFYGIDSAGRAEPLTSLSMSAADIAATSSSITFVAESNTRPQELALWDRKAAPQIVSSFNNSFDRYALTAPEFVHFKSFDGKDIEAALLKPANASAQSPAILLIHGGPTGNWRDDYDSWAQMLVSAGYVVLEPNVRGSTGYGYGFMVSNRADWGGNDFKDVMAAADYLVSSGLADANRLGIAGWSYGGYMSEWAITQTNRFKAAVSGAGMADLATEYGTEEHPSYDEWFYGLPYEKPEGFRKSSPINYVKNAKTPTLILQGDADTIDPLSQSQMLYRALKRYGVATELVVYPREGHGLKEEKHLVDRLNRIEAWFDKYLK